MNSYKYKYWKLCAWGGPVYIVGSILGFGIIGPFLPPPAEYWNAQEVSQFYIDNSLSIRIGLTLAMMCTPFYFVWSCAVSNVMREIEGDNGVLSNVEIMGGVATTLVTYVCLVLFLTAAFRTDTRAIGNIQTLNDVGWMIFNLTFVATLLQMLAIALVFFSDCRKEPLLPRWYPWFTVASGVLFFPVVLIPFLQHGPFSWHGLITFWIVLGTFFCWIGVTSFYIFRGIRRLENEGRV